MTTRTKRAIIAALALFGATVLVGAIGLWRGLNVVNVHVETIRDEDGHYHRRWTFTGGRWESYGQGFKNGEHFVVLDPPGARAPAALRFLKETLGMGANRLVYEVEARRILPRGGNGPSFLSIKRTLSGNANGAPRLLRDQGLHDGRCPLGFTIPDEPGQRYHHHRPGEDQTG